MNSIEFCVIGTVIVVTTILFVYAVFNFLIEVPKQLKRIADALEKEDHNG